ncbi:PIN domain-containing protein [soil metagenome]
MRPFVDTNVWVYAHDRDEPVKQEVALKLLGSLGGSVTLSTQVLGEFYVAVTRKMATPLPPEVAEEQVADLARADVITTDAALVREAIVLSRKSQLSFWDALVVRAAVKGGCDTLWSEDLSNGQVVDGVTVRNPFASPG